MTIQLKEQYGPVNIEVEEEGDAAIVGKNKSGKRFVTRPDRVGEFEQAEPVEKPARWRYRIYVRRDGVIRALDPSFSAVEAWFTDDDAEDTITVLQEDLSHRIVHRDEVLSLLSARPEDDEEARKAAQVASNGHAVEDEDDEAEVD